MLNSFTVAEPVLGVNEIARRVDPHKSTVSRILATLELVGLVERDEPSGRFRPGVGVIAACLGLGLLTVPAYALAGSGTAGHALVAQLLLACGAVTANVVTAVLLPEVFPTAVRYTASAVTHNVSCPVFGGTAPSVSTLLASWTGSRLSPAVHITVIAAVSPVAALSLPETSR